MSRPLSIENLLTIFSLPQSLFHLRERSGGFVIRPAAVGELELLNRGAGVVRHLQAGAVIEGELQLVAAGVDGGEIRIGKVVEHNLVIAVRSGDDIAAVVLAEVELRHIVEQISCS